MLSLFLDQGFGLMALKPQSLVLPAGTISPTVSKVYSGPQKHNPVNGHPANQVSNRGTLLPPPMRARHHHRSPSTFPPRLRRARGPQRTQAQQPISNINININSSIASIPMPLRARKLQRLRHIPPRPNDALFLAPHKNHLHWVHAARSRFQARY